MVGRDLIRKTISVAHATPIKDLPVEYVKHCTNNFSEDTKLGQGGSGTVFLAIDPDDRKINYVAKRIPVDDIEDNAALFRRELEVKIEEY